MSDIAQIPPSGPEIPSKVGKKTAGMTLSLKDRHRLNEATADFEALFIQQLFKSMRKTIPEDAQGGLFAKGEGEKIFGEMLDGEYAKSFSRGRSGLGLKEAIFKQTIDRQLASGVDVQQTVNKMQGSENSLNALQHSPIGKEGGPLLNVVVTPLGKPDSTGWICGIDH